LTHRNETWYGSAQRKKAEKEEEEFIRQVVQQ